MTKLYIRVPTTQNTKEHWALISTNAEGPGPDSEGLLHLRQYDGTWHRHAPKNYPDVNALRIRLKNGDFPEALRMGQVLSQTPTVSYDMLFQVLSQPNEPIVSGYVNTGTATTFYDGSTPVMPQPYQHDPYEIQDHFPFEGVFHVPDDFTPFYNGHDPAVFYPKVYVENDDQDHYDFPLGTHGRDRIITSIINANGRTRGAPGSSSINSAGARKSQEGWIFEREDIFTLNDIHRPYYLFPPRLVSHTTVTHFVADLRWVRNKMPVANVAAVEIVLKGYYNFYARPKNQRISEFIDLAEQYIFISDSTNAVPVHEASMIPSTINFWYVADPTAKIFVPGNNSLTNARNLFDSVGSVLATYNVLGDADGSQIGEYEATAGGYFEYRQQLSRSDFDNNDYLIYTVSTSPLPDPAEYEPEGDIYNYRHFWKGGEVGVTVVVEDLLVNVYSQ